MKKITLLIISVLMISGIAFTQEGGGVGKGGKLLNFGIGFIDGIPMHIGVDFGVHQDVTLGPEVDFDLSGFDWMRIKFRADYHWNTLMGISGPWDVYSGAALGPKIGFGGNGNVDFLFQVNLGGRWYWSDWGLNSEFGLGTDINWRFGVSKRF